MAHSEIFHFENISVVTPHLRVEIPLNVYDARFAEAQRWLGSTVLEDCKPYMPIDTGDLQQLASVEDDGRRVVFNAPYARFQYGGKVMVGEETNRPWARAGEKKVLTDRNLSYSNRDATDHWFDAAKEAHGDFWIKGAAERIGGRQA